MHKLEVIKSIAAITKHTLKDAETILESFMEVVVQALKKGDDIRLIGFGTFKTVKRKARNGKNPKTGIVIKIPARTFPKFVPGKKLAEAVQK